MLFKLQVADRNYDSFDIVPLEGTTVPDINPIEHKLFNQDIFNYDSDTNNTLVQYSSTRLMENIPGVLVLDGNKRYGKYKKRFLYKCVPDDHRLPIFMVPYMLRLGFNKRLYNKYITFGFNNWGSKHPQGLIVQTLGDVTELPVFYEYQLYCKSLHASIQNFNKVTMRALKTTSEDEFINRIQTTHAAEDRRNWDIISIDPKNSKDFDDAFGIKELDNNRCLISIYIANVTFWMDALKIWDSFSQRVSTIYLPDRKRPMLPNILSDALCSLQENRSRFAFTLDIIVNKKNWCIEDSSFKNTCICLRKNLRYDTEEQRSDEMYQRALHYVKQMNKVNSYIDNVSNCHDVIAYLMILMNYISAIYLKSKKTGIFRSAKFNKEYVTPKTVPEDVQKFLKMYRSVGGQYVKYEQVEGHEMLNLDAYVHITSPIRRLVDLLNIMAIQDSLGLMKLEGSRQTFYDKWTNKKSVEYINQQMKSARKVQNDCDLLNMCTTDKDILGRIHEGFIFDKTIRKDELYQYTVYFPEFKMINRFTSLHDKEGLSSQKFKLYVFMDENSLKQKIRIELQVV
jgi:exoribonuclease R